MAAAGLCCAATSRGQSTPAAAAATPTIHERMLEVARAHPKWARLDKIGQSFGGEALEILVVGPNDGRDRQRPGLLIVAGLEGHDQLGPQATLAWVTGLIARAQSDGQVRQALEQSAIYLFANANPDAQRCTQEAALKHACTTNRRPTDDDLDGLVDEDPIDDLNQDGLITQMRIADGKGDRVLDPLDPRLSLPVDAQSANARRFSYHVEGRDQDRDERFNEDGEGGVKIATNFGFDFPWFEAGAGTHPFSEPESQALAQWLVGHSNVGVSYVFGEADNLSSACLSAEDAAKPPASAATPPTNPFDKREAATKTNANDVPVFALVGQEWRRALGLRFATKATSHKGALIDWLYYHRGMWAFGGPAWGVEIELARSGLGPTGRAECVGLLPAAAPLTAQNAEAKDKDKGKAKANDDRRNAYERAFLSWLDGQAPASFLPWKAVAHPDFPNQLVEVGGWVVSAKSLPPPPLRDALIQGQVGFLDHLLQWLPRVAVQEVEVKPLGQGVFEVRVQVANRGYLPTLPEHAQSNRIAPATRVELDLPANQVLGGDPRMRLAALAGGAQSEVHWVVQGRGRQAVDVVVVSTFAGTQRIKVPLNVTKPLVQRGAAIEMGSKGALP